MNNMVAFYLPVTWEECGVVEIEANTIEEAIAYFNENTDDIESPADTNYVDGSFCLSSSDVEKLKCMHEHEKNRREV